VFGREEEEEVELEGRKSFRLSVSSLQQEKKTLITKGLPACFVAVTGDSKQASHHKTRRKCVRSGMCPWCLSTGGVLLLLLPITAACLNFPHSDSLSLCAQNPVQLWAGCLCNCEQDFLCNCEQGFQDFCAIVRRIFCATTVSRIFCRRDEGIY